MAFTKLKSTYKQRTGNQFEESDYDSFLLVLKNLNYEQKVTIKSDDKKATIKKQQEKLKKA